MTDYNDGKWHGWNGGECPVDPDAEIEIRWADPKESANNHSGRAGKWDARCWNAPPLYGQIIAFRVTKPAPPKPREWWLLEGADGSIRSTATVPINTCGCHDKIIHVIEKLP